MSRDDSCTLIVVTRLLPPAYVFFFNDTATTEIYTLSLHDALPILPREESNVESFALRSRTWFRHLASRYDGKQCQRSEEHTSELQSRQYLVCRLLLEKKKQADGHKKTRVPYHKRPNRVVDGHGSTI